MNLGRITFKSYPHHWIKEKKGIKNNTLRIVENQDNRFKLLRDFWERPHFNSLQIKIINTETNKSFVREIRDVTYFEELVIITWSV